MIKFNETHLHIIIKNVTILYSSHKHQTYRKVLSPHDVLEMELFIKK